MKSHREFLIIINILYEWIEIINTLWILWILYTVYTNIKFHKIEYKYYRKFLIVSNENHISQCIKLSKNLIKTIEICGRTIVVKIFEKFSNLGSSSVTRRISVHISGTFSIKNGERAAEERSPGFRYRFNDKHSDYLFYVASSRTGWLSAWRYVAFQQTSSFCV